MVLEKIDCEIAGITAATRRERLEAKPPAIILGTYPISSTALRTLDAVRSLSFAGELKNRDTVAVETPAAAATSLIVSYSAADAGALCAAGKRECLDFERLEADIANSVGRTPRNVLNDRQLRSSAFLDNSNASVYKRACSQPTASSAPPFRPGAPPFFVRDLPLPIKATRSLQRHRTMSGGGYPAAAESSLRA